jgi:hypothetical protein
MTNIKLLPSAAGANPSLHDVPLLLRRLAERIEFGDYGDTKAPDFIIRFAGVLRVTGSEPIIFGFGATANSTQTFADLHAGAAQLMSMASPER